MTALLVPLAAVAEEWKAYTYPEPGFSIEFPGVPVVQSSRIKNSLGLSLPMTRYELRQGRILYTLTVVNYSLTNADALTTIVETERALSASGKVAESRGARIKRVFGRQLTLDGGDGSRSAIAIFFVNRHLYTMVAQVLPPHPVGLPDDAIRFEQSLQFPDDSGSWFSGIGGLFGGGGSRGGADSGSGNRETRPRPAASLPSDATCAGKSAGDAVQLETPGGPVPAICTLVARPLGSPAATH